MLGFVRTEGNKGIPCPGVHNKCIEDSKCYGGLCMWTMELNAQGGGCVSPEKRFLGLDWPPLHSVILCTVDILLW